MLVHTIEELLKAHVVHGVTPGVDRAVGPGVGVGGVLGVGHCLAKLSVVNREGRGCNV